MAEGNFKFKNKKDYCRAWIEGKAAEVGCDKFATEQGATSSGELKNIEVLPWCTYSAFYEEFRFEQGVIKGVPDWRIPKRDTFYQALRSLKKRLRIMKCKGNSSMLSIK